MVAEVIINSTAKALNKEFHYIVPKNLENVIKIGDRVFAPFGKRSIEEGFVIGLLDNSPYANKEIKSIGEGLSKENINLAKLMARRYFCNISDCIKLMLPPGTITKKFDKRVKEKTENFVYLKINKQEVQNKLSDNTIKSQKQLRILKFLLENDNVNITDLQDLTDTTRAIIKTLEKNGYLEIKEERIERNPIENKEIKRDKPYKLNDEQQNAFNTIIENINKFNEFLIYGVTGSRQNRNIYATY